MLDLVTREQERSPLARSLTRMCMHVCATQNYRELWRHCVRSVVVAVRASGNATSVGFSHFSLHTWREKLDNGLPSRGIPQHPTQDGPAHGTSDAHASGNRYPTQGARHVRMVDVNKRVDTSSVDDMGPVRAVSVLRNRETHVLGRSTGAPCCVDDAGWSMGETFISMLDAAPYFPEHATTGRPTMPSALACVQTPRAPNPRHTPAWQTYEPSPVRRPPSNPHVQGTSGP